MKKIFYSAVISLLFIITSCEKKYEEGPQFSLRSAKARVAGDWKLEKFSYNNVDLTAGIDTLFGSNFMLEFSKGGSYSITGYSVDHGTWELGEDKDDILLKSDDPNSIQRSYRILKLKNKELWFKETQSNGDVLEFHFMSTGN